MSSMDVYRRYASGEHDKQHFDDIANTAHIKLRPFSATHNASLSTAEPKLPEFWKAVLPQAAYFSGYDAALFGRVVTALYKNEATGKMCAVSITKYGCNFYENLILDSTSRFWPACTNLTEAHRSSNVRRTLAIANLKNYNKILNSKRISDLQVWDETNAGALASSMVLMEQAPAELCSTLLSLDFLQELQVSAFVIDVLYDNNYGTKAIDENNALVTLLGHQMEQLFDPLLEYSPQAMDFSYAPPDSPVSYSKESHAVQQVISELVTVQSNFTMELVALLQEFIIPLRVHVLADVSSTTNGSIKVNTVFPPTIDEVTRINCILHSTLQVAAGYGYAEVFKVLASILPFFYKAFARHQANIACFHSRFEKFLKHNKSYAFEDATINTGNYTPKIVENIILGSLFELPKLKLIIKRLYELVESEKLKLLNFESSDFGSPEDISASYRTILETIDSIGCGENESTKDSTKARIFTPSGKILTEIATGWPAELQYGWMNRKVVAIYELENVEVAHDESNENGREVMIIFSDHVIFMSVEDVENGQLLLPLPDVLMNSLVNQKPLPRLSHFPKLKVKYWCGVEQLLVKSYPGHETHNLTFTAYGENFFHLKAHAEKLFSVNYAVKSVNSGSTAESICHSIISHVCKAQILHKSSPFHLFRSSDNDFARFYCAHDLQNYAGEIAKSPIVFLLNLDEKLASEILQKFLHIHVVLTLSFLNEHTVQVQGYSREKDFGIDEMISTEDLAVYLKDLLARCMDALLQSDSFYGIITGSNTAKLNLMVNGSITELDQPKSQTKDAQAVSKSEDRERQSVLEQLAKAPKTVQALPPKEAAPQNLQRKETVSFVLRFLHRLKSKHSKPSKKTRSKELPQKKEAQIDNSGIPRGQKIAYKKLYKPDPLLREASVSSSVADENPKTLEQKSNQLESDATQPRIASRNTVLSSRYSGSVDVNSNFQFPLMYGLDKILEDNGISTEDSEKLKSNMGSVRYAPKKVAHQPGVEDSEENEKREIETDTETEIIVIDPLKNAEANWETAEDRLQSQNKASDKSPLNPRFDGKKLAMQSMEQPTRATEKKLSTTENHNSSARLKCNTASTRAPVKSLIIPETKLENAKDTEIVTTNESNQIKGELESVDEGDNAKPEVAFQLVENSNDRALQRAFSKYKIYDEIPLLIFNLDKEANWTALARDSLSNLHAEVQAMKADISDGSVSNAGTIMRPQMQQYDSTNETFSTLEMVTYVTESEAPSDKSLADIRKLIYDVDTSMKRSNSDIVGIFSKQLDSEFGLLLNETSGEAEVKDDVQLESPATDSFKSNDTKVERPSRETEETGKTFTKESNNSCLTVNTGEHKMLIDRNSNVTSSEEEYYSSHEFSNVLDFYNKGGDLEQETFMMTSSSSEKTLMNDFLVPEKKHIEEIPQTTKWVGNVRSIELVDDFGSLAYLSDILKGDAQI